MPSDTRAIRKADGKVAESDRKSTKPQISDMLPNSRKLDGKLRS